MPRTLGMQTENIAMDVATSSTESLRWIPTAHWFWRLPCCHQSDWLASLASWAIKQVVSKCCFCFPVPVKEECFTKEQMFSSPHTQSFYDDPDPPPSVGPLIWYALEKVAQFWITKFCFCCVNWNTYAWDAGGSSVFLIHCGAYFDYVMVDSACHMSLPVGWKSFSCYQFFCKFCCKVNLCQPHFSCPLKNHCIDHRQSLSNGTQHTLDNLCPKAHTASILFLLSVHP